MKRPFLFISVFFSVGIVIAQYIFIPLKIGISILFLNLPFVYISKRNRLFFPLLALVLITLGATYKTSNSTLSRDHIGRIDVKERISVEGIVATLPEIKKDGKREIQSFVLDAKNMMHKGVFSEASGKLQVFLYNPKVSADFGDYVRIFGYLEKAKRPRNPGEFDYGRYLEKSGIYALLKAYGYSCIKILKHSRTDSFLCFLTRLRKRIKEKIDWFLVFPESEILSALVIGHRKGIPYELRDNFTKTGTIHILAVSGLHISIFGGFVYFILRFLGFPQKLNALITIGVIISYIFIAGAKLPVARAGIMGTVLLLGIVFEREKDIFNALFLAFFLLLLVNPSSIFSPAFQLSFVAIFSIILFTPQIERFLVRKETKEEAFFRSGIKTYQRKVAHFFLRLFSASLAASVGSLPLVIYYFNIFSPIGLFANLILIPLVSLAIFSGGLFILISFISEYAASLISTLCFLVLRTVSWSVDILSLVPFGNFHVASPLLIFIPVYYVFLLMLRFFSKGIFQRRSFRMGLWVLWYVSLACLFFPFRDKAFEMTFLDLRGGSSIFISTPNKERILINGGSQKPTDQGRWTVKPFLMGCGVKDLDAIFINSFYQKDIGGLETILRDISCDYFFIPENEVYSSRYYRIKGILRANKSQTVRLKNTDRINFSSGLSFEVFAEDAKRRSAKLSDSSLAMRLNYEGLNCLLLPRGSSRFLELLQENPECLKSQVVLISDYKDYTPEKMGKLLDLSDPQVIIAVTAEDLTVDPEICNMLKEKGVFCLHPDRLGSVTLIYKEHTLSIKAYIDDFFKPMSFNIKDLDR